jgi:hypothetical protein
MGKIALEEHVVRLRDAFGAVSAAPVDRDEDLAGNGAGPITRPGLLRTSSLRHAAHPAAGSAERPADDDLEESPALASVEIAFFSGGRYSADQNAQQRGIRVRANRVRLDQSLENGCVGGLEYVPATGPPCLTAAESAQQVCGTAAVSLNQLVAYRTAGCACLQAGRW